MKRRHSVAAADFDEDYALDTPTKSISVRRMSLPYKRARRSSMKGCATNMTKAQVSTLYVTNRRVAPHRHRDSSLRLCKMLQKELRRLFVSEKNSQTCEGSCRQLGVVNPLSWQRLRALVVRSLPLLLYLLGESSGCSGRADTELTPYDHQCFLTTVSHLEAKPASQLHHSPYARCQSDGVRVAHPRGH